MKVDYYTYILTCIYSYHHIITVTYLLFFIFKKDVHTKLKNKQESSSNSSEINVESKDTVTEMEVTVEDGSKFKIKEGGGGGGGGGHSAPLLASSVKDKPFSNNIQIKASCQEVQCKNHDHKF